MIQLCSFLSNVFVECSLFDLQIGNFSCSNPPFDHRSCSNDCTALNWCHFFAVDLALCSVDSLKPGTTVGYMVELVGNYSDMCEGMWYKHNNTGDDDNDDYLPKNSLSSKSKSSHLGGAISALLGKKTSDATNDKYLLIAGVSCLQLLVFCWF